MTFQLARLGEGPPRKPARRPARRATRLKVEAAVWRVALDLAHDDPGRIEIISTTEVVVHNKRKDR